MKILFCILLSLTYFTLCYSQTNPTEIQKLATLGKVWGFLKYYHPAVTTGKLDWDKVLIDKIQLIKTAKTKEEINKVYSDWMTSLGEVRKCNKCKNNIPDSLKYNLDLKWIYDTTIFSSDNTTRLNFIRENRSRKQGYYIKNPFASAPSFEGENPYKEMTFPTEDYRIVGLFRYWNIIQYFFPYKYLIGEDWNKVLEEMIPFFQNCSDVISYNLAIAQITNRVNDSHACFYSTNLNQYFGFKSPACKIALIDNKAIIKDSWNDSLMQANDLQIGDIILKYNGKEIIDLIKENEKYIGASNNSAKRRNLSESIFRSNQNTAEVIIERNGQILTRTIKFYYFEEFNYKQIATIKKTCKVLTDSIGYINMGLLKKDQVDSIMIIMMKQRAIIFDIRNYPQFILYDISKYLNNKRQAFVSFTKPDFSYPGVFTKKYNGFCGIKNKNYYKGKVIILFNEETQSRAEFTCMALQTAPNATSIGSQTAGADGNVTSIVFPGNYYVWMTGLGIYYPNGRETQRIGLVPDIEVKPTIEGIRARKDEVLERAIEFINTGK